MALKTGEIIVLKFHHLTILFVSALLISALCLSQDMNYYINQMVNKQVTVTGKQQSAGNGTGQRCDYFLGRWVYDNVSFPFYKEKDCHFMEGAFACEKYGRKDLMYQNWRWQPQNCNLPSFNGKLFLEKLKGKKIIFVGDSLCRNQWVSMLCLIESSLPPSTKKMYNLTGNLQYFHIGEHNTTIGFYWSPFLVESNCDDAWHHQFAGRVVRVHGIENHARHWNDADILIFDSYAWWMNHTMKILWGSFGSPDAIYKPVVMKMRRYEMAMRTWSDWLEVNINRTKTKMFFMSVSPYTFRGDKSRQCYNISHPISREKLGSIPNYNLIKIIESTIEKLRERGVKVKYMRITEMSEYRRDAHPSIYRLFYNKVTEEDRKDPNRYADCIHWCLPGVPDVWNQILYSHIMNS